MHLHTHMKHVHPVVQLLHDPFPVSFKLRGQLLPKEQTNVTPLFNSLHENPNKFNEMSVMLDNADPAKPYNGLQRTWPAL